MTSLDAPYLVHQLSGISSSISRLQMLTPHLSHDWVTLLEKNVSGESSYSEFLKFYQGNLFFEVHPEVTMCHSASF